MKTKAVVIAIFLALSVSLPLLPSPAPSSVSAASCPANRTLHIVLNGGAPNSLSLLTAATQSAFDLTYSVFYGVYPAYYPNGTLDYNMSLVDWISHNSNYTQWTFNVKPNLKWSNGQPVTAQDILATYSNQFAFNASFDFTGVHNEVVSSSALNTSAAVFNLNQSDAHFPETISQLVLTNVSPASMISKYGTAYTGFESDSAVVGPYYPVNYQLGQTEMTMAVNPYFQPQPLACQLDVTFVEGTTQAASLLKGGAADLAPLDASSVAGVLGNPNVHVLIQNDSYITTLNYNITTYPFNMTAFRQALVYGIDQNTIVNEALAGYGETAYSAEGTVPQAVTALYNPNQMTYQYNQSEAMALLNSIGLNVVGGHLQYSNGSDVTFTLWGDTTFSWDSVAAGIVQNDLQNLGMTVNLHLTTYGDLTSMPSLPQGTMTLASNFGVVFPDPSVDSLPGWDVYVLPGVANSYWMYPPNINAQYEGNATGIANTDNAPQLKQYMYNIEALGAQYLPAVTLDYGAGIWGYSTQRWTNWAVFPQGWYHMNSNTNNLELANLVPVGYTAPTTSTSTTTSPSTSPVSTTTSQAPPSTTTSQSSPPVTTTTTKTSSGIAYPSFAVFIVIATIALATIGFSRMRRITR